MKHQRAKAGSRGSEFGKEQIGRAMLTVARHVFPKRALESKNIRAAARLNWTIPLGVSTGYLRAIIRSTWGSMARSGDGHTDYSYRSATMGSTFVARRAGM